MFHIAELAYCHCSVVLETAFLCVTLLFSEWADPVVSSLAERQKHEKDLRPEDKAVLSG